MEGSTLSKPTTDKTHPWVLLIPLVTLLTLGGASPESPQLKKITWQVISQTGDVVWSTTANHALGTWWPTLTPDFCHLATGADDSWGVRDVAISDLNKTTHPGTVQHPGCRTPLARCRWAQHDFYVCPGDGRDRKLARKCGGARDFFCASWGCETTGSAWWNPKSSWDLIKLERGFPKAPGGWFYCAPEAGLTPTTGQNHYQAGLSLPLKITFTETGKSFPEWTRGRVWGLRLYEKDYNRGLTFTIRLQVSEIQTAAVGPNQVLKEHKSPGMGVARVPTHIPGLTTPPTILGTGDRLLDLIQGAYLALNTTAPEKTQDCWLCLISSPPYYEGIAVTGNYTSQTSPQGRCLSTPMHKLTLSEVSGQGFCVGNVPTTHLALCNQIHQPTEGNYYLAAPYGTYWACSTGLTPCISRAVLDTTSDYCVLVELWPRVIYHTSEYILNYAEQRSRLRREPVSLTLALLLRGVTMGELAAGIGTRTAALLETSQFKQLQSAMHEDIKALEESVSALEKSLTSLSEVVLQNRRGLDILFLQERGVCAALKEECCFYADHTGLVRDNMAKLRERLKQRQQLFESQQGWFEGWFNRSPWFTTLISSLLGPLIILTLLLLFGPCILNRLVQFVKDRVSVVQALVLTQQYHRLRHDDQETQFN